MKKSFFVGICIGTLVNFSNNLVFAETNTDAEISTPTKEVSTVSSEDNVIDSLKNILFGTENEDKAEIMKNYQYLPTDVDALSACESAEKEYYFAQNQGITSERKLALSKSMEYISKAYAKDNKAVKTLFLASKIFRAYGIKSYAEKYNQAAIDECVKCLVENLDCRQAHLDLAVLYVAGMSESDKEYNACVQKAEIHAYEVVSQIKALKKPNGRAFYQAAVASLILNNKDDAVTYMRKAIDSEYITDMNYKKICEELIEKKFTVYPTEEKYVVINFLSYSFGRID